MADYILKDVVAVLLFRSIDHKIALQNKNTLGLWLPYKEVESSKSWSKIAEQIVKTLSSSGKILKTLHICRIHPNENVPAVMRVVFLAEVNQVLENLYNTYWFSSQELEELPKNVMRDLEPVLFSKVLKYANAHIEHFSELSVNNSFISHIPESDNVPKSNYESLIDSTGFGIEGQKLVYQDFICHTYPCHTMNIHTFHKYIKSFNWWSEDKLNRILAQLFRAFDSNSTGYLTYKDFLVGLAVMNHSTPHSGAPADIRCRFIFRYYDTNNDGIMESSEFRSMISDIKSIENCKMDEMALDYEVQEHFKTFQVQGKEKLFLANFLQIVGQLKFRGTSSLLRSPMPVIHSIIIKRGLTSISTNFENSPSNKRPRENSPGTYVCCKSVNPSSKLRIERVYSEGSCRLEKDDLDTETFKRKSEEDEHITVPSVILQETATKSTSNKRKKEDSESESEQYEELFSMSNFEPVHETHSKPNYIDKLDIALRLYKLRNNPYGATFNYFGSSYPDCTLNSIIDLFSSDDEDSDSESPDFERSFGTSKTFFDRSYCSELNNLDPSNPEKAISGFHSFSRPENFNSNTIELESLPLIYHIPDSKGTTSPKRKRKRNF